jgi:hypothetical protein
MLKSYLDPWFSPLWNHFEIVALVSLVSLFAILTLRLWGVRQSNQLHIEAQLPLADEDTVRSGS